jgi:ubiquinone/menaquinone biosynthesis C-methylase UbiE
MSDSSAGWSELAATYDKTRSFPGDGDHAVPMAVGRKLAALGARRVLDLGCGTGRFAVPLARTGVRVVGADRSPEMLSMLLAKRADLKLDVVRCDVEALPFRRAFDAVFFSHVLHLLPSIPNLARELRAVLLADAHVVVVDTSAGPRPATIRVLGHVIPLLDEAFVPWPTGEDSRDRSLLRELLGRLGGEEVEVVPVDVYPHTTSLREVLEDVRKRTWWTFRRREAEPCVRAADAAERLLVAEGADLDARVDEPVVVRLLVGRLRAARG